MAAGNTGNVTVSEKEAQEQKLERLSFWDVFQLMNDGNLRPRRTISWEDTILKPNRTFAFVGETNLLEYSDCDFGVYEREDGVLEIAGYYDPVK